MATINALAERIQAEVAPAKADLSEVLRRIGEVLDASIEGVSVLKNAPPTIDLSAIDFKALAQKFKTSETKNLDLERLKAAIAARLDRLISLNETRVDLREQFETLIDEYNAGSAQIEQLFQALLDLTKTLSEEETRHVRESLSEEELTVFDLLTRPGPDLSAAEREEVKRVARALLGRLRALFVADWQKTAQSRARILDAIEQALDDGLPRVYTPDIFKMKAGWFFNMYMNTTAAPLSSAQG